MFTLDTLNKITIAEYMAYDGVGIETTKTACNYGGYRHWFVCDCGRRVGVLYFAHSWRCRHCVGYLYQSQLNQPLDRLNERINRIRTRLGWARGVANGIGEKPKGMHKKTFTRLLGEYNQLTNNLIGAYHGKYNP